MRLNLKHLKTTVILSKNNMEMDAVLIATTLCKKYLIFYWGIYIFEYKFMLELLNSS